MTRVGQAWKAVANAFDQVTPMRVILAVLVTSLVLVHGLVPGFRMDGMTIALLSLLAILVLTPLLKSASFLGGGFVFKDVEKLNQDATEFKQDTFRLHRVRVVHAPPGSVPTLAGPEGTSAPALKDIEVATSVRTAAETALADSKSEGAEPTGGHTTFDDLLAQAHGSRRLALLKLTDNLQAATSRLLVRGGHQPSSSLLANTRRLVDTKSLPPIATDLMRRFISVRNQIVPGEIPDDDAVLATLDIGVSILNTIELIESGQMPEPSEHQADASD